MKMLWIQARMRDSLITFHQSVFVVDKLVRVQCEVGRVGEDICVSTSCQIDMRMCVCFQQKHVFSSKGGVNVSYFFSLHRTVISQGVSALISSLSNVA